jgi:hypothetical protein
MPAKKPSLHRMTEEERAALDRDKKIKRMARDIQHTLDRDLLYAKLPDVVAAMIGTPSDDSEFDDETLTVEYSEEYGHRLVPMASLIVKTRTTYFQEGKLTVLLGIARALGMVGTVRASREENYDGEHELEFSLRPRSSKIGEPSAEAIAEATKLYDEAVAASA